MRELDLSQLKTPRVFVDSAAACEEEAGELRGYQGGIVELGALVGTETERRHEGATVYKSVGIGAMDVRVASLVFERAESDNLGTLVDL
jgi:ornithine cyclodeaminase/alanine dehydrogenase-like protein (mu-crystallin family)